MGSRRCHSYGAIFDKVLRRQFRKIRWACKQYEGILDPEKIQEKIKDDPVGKALKVKGGRMPIQGAGITCSRGLSSLFNRIDCADSLIT